MSKYPCDNWSWSSRRCDPKLRDRHDANKENREPISPLSRLAKRVDDSRRWAPIPDRWHNHCEWMVNHHRNLRKRFRRTTANDRLSGVLTTLKCTRERRRGSEEDGSVIGSEARCKRIRSEVEYPELEPASTWLGSVHPELFQQKLLSPLKDEPFLEEDDAMELETQKSALTCTSNTNDDMDIQPTKPNPLSQNGESIAESAKSSLATAFPDGYRCPSPVDGNFEPESFRTSTPTAHEKGRRDAEEPFTTFRRSSAWKDYVMSHDPILFRSYVDTQFPKKSWRHSHQKLAARHGGKFRRSSSGRIRKPPTPKSLRISWNSLDDVVQNEGILRSPLQLPPILPGDVTPPVKAVNDHSGDLERDGDLSANNSYADADLGDVIVDEIRAIRKDCTARYHSADDSYAASDERDAKDGIDQSELSDISLGEEEGSSDKHEYDLDEVSSDEDIDDICRIVDKELHHHDYHPDDILTEISFDILDDLEVDSKYPPNYFRAGFADRAVRRRKMKKATTMINNLDPQARSFKPKFTRDGDNADQRIVKFADRETPDQVQVQEPMDDECGGGGTKFYPSDVRFNNKDGLEKVKETPKASEHKHAELKALMPLPVPVPVKQKDIPVPESAKKESKGKKEESGQQECRKGEVSKTVDSERSVPKAEAEQIRDLDKNEKTSSIKPIAKGKAKRQVAHKISVVMGRRPWKPSQIMENPNVDDGGRSVPAAVGDDDNSGVVQKRIPQLRRVEIHQDCANDAGNGGRVPSSEAKAVETVRTDGAVHDKDLPHNVATGVKGHMDSARTEANIQSHSLPPESSVRNIDVSKPRHSALMKQRLAILKESHGNSPLGEARLVNLTDHVQERHDSQKTTRVITGVTSNECEQPHLDRLEIEHRYVELPDVNNNLTVHNARQAKINQKSKFGNSENKDKIDIENGISDHVSGSKQKELSCKKPPPETEKQPEPLMNIERAMPLQFEQTEVRRSRATPLTETGRDNHPPPPLIQNPPHRFQHPPHAGVNPNAHPNMHPNMRTIPGNAHLYHQHPPDQPRPLNPTFSVYHRHQMALRAAAMHYYNQHRHMVLQRHHHHHHPEFFPPHPHLMNMHPGYRPEWNMPGPGPPR